MTPTPNLLKDLQGWQTEKKEPTTVPMLRGADWARDRGDFVAKRHLATEEWYIQCEFFGLEALRETVEIDPSRRGGVPLLKGTGFTVAQLLAELAETDGPDDIAENFDLDAHQIREFLNGLSLLVQKPRAR